MNATMATLRTSPPQRVPLWVFLGASVPTLFLYAATRARTVTGEDSGELITAAWQLGVAHPPGFPIWVLLTKAFQTIFGGLNPADAAALGSGITTAAAMGLLAVLAHRLTGSVVASLFGAWCVAVGHEIWNHATIAEVYPLNLLVLAAVLLLFDRWREEPSRKRLCWLSLVYGCGMANHPTFLLFLPLFAVAVIVRQPRIVLDWRAVGLGLAGLIAPHLAYLQTWIAAANNPFVSWGAEPNLRSMIGHYLREPYAAATVEKTARSAGKVLAQGGAMLRFLIDNLTIPGTLVAALGLGLLARRDRLMGGLALALFAAGTAGLLFVIDFDLEREDLFAFRVFLMPAYLVAGIGFAAAASAILRRLSEPASVRLAFATILVPVVACAVSYRAHDRSNYLFSADYARALLDGIPKEAIVLPGGDTSTFPMLYLTACEHIRPDVAIIDRSGTIERQEALALLPEARRGEFAKARREALVEGLIRFSKRPVFTVRPERSGEDDYVWEPLGLGYVAVARKDTESIAAIRARHEALMGALRFTNETSPTVEDYTADVIRSHVAQVRAALFFRKGDPPRAVAACHDAMLYGGGIKETFNNVGSLLAESSMTEEAIACFRQALEIRGDYDLARRNLIVTLRKSGRKEDVLDEALRGIERRPGDVFLFEEAVEAAMALGQGDVVRRVCAARIAAEPGDPRPHRYLGIYALEHEHADVVAEVHLREALKRDPDNKELARRLREVEARTTGQRPDVPEVEGAEADAGIDQVAAMLRARTPSFRTRPTTPRRAGAPAFGSAALGGDQIWSFADELRSIKSPGAPMGIPDLPPVGPGLPAPTGREP